MEIFTYLKKFIPNKHANEKILNLTHLISSVFPTHMDNPIKIPTCVVVGTQSSGKSSLINMLIGMPILPMGKSMVTRVPLNLQLIEGGSRKIEFGKYEGGTWIVIASTKTPSEVSQIIERETINIAGDSKNIGHKEICIRVYGAETSLNFIDLPGLTMVACTDLGQPPDIKQQIKNLIEKYTSVESNIIIGVFPARQDLEADYGLDFIKKYDSNFNRSIGVLTKVDLMQGDLIPYLQGGSHDALNTTNPSISDNLKLKWGYYAVNTRDGDTYFDNIEWAKTPSLTNRIGVKNLSKQLYSILLQSIRESLPKVINIAGIQRTKLLNELNEIGEPPKNKAITMNNMIREFCDKFKESLDNRHPEINCGRIICEEFCTYRKNLEKINFHLTPQYLNEVVKNCNGNHMPSGHPTIDILEAIIHDPKKKPLDMYRDISYTLVKQIKDHLTHLVKQLSRRPKIWRFRAFAEKLCTCVQRCIMDETQVINLVDILLESEESYVWSENAEFRRILEGNGDIKSITKAYLDTTTSTLANVIPKIIMRMVCNIQDNMYVWILEGIGDIENLLVEDPIIANRRIDLISQIDAIDGIFTYVNNLDASD
uniref:Dynamin family protein n=1 Tax=Megaviridae environmental sample TaxID=1737588 RepID=A0A5J6VJW7_9VIRU|nr:MAG: dynamin family protein [Megaviridae environmental sample]